ncbi:uncharacterized protein LOC119279040 [Triticum dicoccoides]|uniref:uncharacterized protein LOC119279040 n=1 Tax=Triticum dicoccoides TaxID=85692 RepID=UPI00188FC09C|nr:uncharacterized protein LOC119279040 [Triticum dicoccoides]XP_037416359.1 uncharacterized protein LOC119279040 [Triticum dicoccoides]
MACDVAADEPPDILTVLELRALDKAPAVCPVQEPRTPDKAPVVCIVRELRAGDAPSAMGRAPDLCADDTEHAAHDRVMELYPTRMAVMEHSVLSPFFPDRDGGGSQCRGRALGSLSVF